MTSWQLLGRLGELNICGLISATRRAFVKLGFVHDQVSI